MLTLIFYVGESAYGIDCEHVVEIIPYVNIERKHRVHDFIAGVVKFYGHPVPVIDFCRIMSNTSCLPCFHSRIAILSLAGERNEMLSLGLIGEKMVELIDIDSSKISEKSFAFGKAPYLGEIVEIQGYTIQLIKTRELFQAMNGDM